MERYQSECVPASKADSPENVATTAADVHPALCPVDRQTAGYRGLIEKFAVSETAQRPGHRQPPTNIDLWLFRAATVLLGVLSIQRHRNMGGRLSVSFSTTQKISYCVGKSHTARRYLEPPRYPRAASQKLPSLICPISLLLPFRPALTLRLVLRQNRGGKRFSLADSRFSAAR